LKAFCTWWANSALETCRQCLGGHGYSAYSGFAEMIGDFGVMCTWEGDNTVLAQQTARFLIKMLRRSYKLRKLTGFESYLENASTIIDTKHNFFPIKNEDQMRQPRILLQAHKYVAVKLLVFTEKRLSVWRAAFGGSKPKAWNQCCVDLIECAKAHCQYFINYSFVETIGSSNIHPSIKDILTKLCLLHSFVIIESNFHHLLQDGYMTNEQVEMVKNQIRLLYKDIRQQAVPLVDAFNLSDIVINSPLGRYDGDIYEKYFEVVNEAPNSSGVPPYFQTLIKPLLDGTSSIEL